MLLENRFVKLTEPSKKSSVKSEGRMEHPQQGSKYTFGAELQKRADRADQSVLFFLAGTNFWEKHAKNTRKQAKTREKQALFWC